LAALSQPVNICFPPVCLHCQTRIADQRMWICGSCYDKLETIPEQHCPRCGYPTPDDYCSNCGEFDYVFGQAKAVFAFDGVAKTLVHALKYEGYSAIATWFARQMHRQIIQEQLFAGTDCLVAIPLHRVRRRERGFNQSELIARALAKLLDKPYAHDLLRRRLHTASQTLLDRKARLQNLHQAFLAGKESPHGLSILLIDDVFTTGTTVNEAAKTLLTAGAAEVNVMTVCHGL
jgi:ComF family protein